MQGDLGGGADRLGRAVTGVEQAGELGPVAGGALGPEHAWSGHSYGQLRTDVYQHTYDVLNALKSRGTTAGTVQIGYETNGGPDDIAVGGFDDSAVATAVPPALTTIRQPWDRIGTGTVRVLLARIGGEDPTAVILPTELVRRESA